MRLIEADGKRLLHESGIAVPDHVFFAFNDVIDVQLGLPAFPFFLKPQVLCGRRGKRGWIKRCETLDDVRFHVASLRDELRNTPCAGFICETVVTHVNQWLVSITLDRVSGIILLNVSEDGGIDVASIKTHTIQSEAAIPDLLLPIAIKDVLIKLYRLFMAQDALCIEINPLAVLADGSCVALDAKIELDDAAAFRHPDWTGFARPFSSYERSELELQYMAFLEHGGHRGTLGRYVELNGDIAMILSGGGASLIAMDALKRAGGSPANYVEMSGNPEAEQVRVASRIVLSKPGIRAVWIAGSFANFTDIQTTVNAVLQAIQDIGLKVPVVIRRDGPMAEVAMQDALKWSYHFNIPLVFHRADVDLDVSARCVVEHAKKYVMAPV